MSELKKYLEKLVNLESLSIEESSRAFQIIMNGGANPSQIAAFLTSLKMKGESIEEISGAVQTMRHKMAKIELPENFRENLIDVCGTGGDGKQSLNISTAVAFVIAGCGVNVAKHGNKAISSKSGSADVLQELGININISPENCSQLIQQIGICFIFAPLYHKAMKEVSDVRKDLGFRTIFNILGPLCNPAQPKNQIIGVFSKTLLDKIPYVLKNLGHKNAMIVHGADGADEISISSETYVAELKNNEVSYYTIKPEDFGISRYEESEIAGGDAKYNASELRKILKGEKNAYYYSVVLNSAAALVVAGKCPSIKLGIALAENSINNGDALRKLNNLVELSNSLENNQN